MDLDKDQNPFPNIIHLPAEILVKIFKHVSKYEEIDIIRQVCRRFKSVSEIILKDAFFDIRNNTLMLLNKYEEKLCSGSCRKRYRNWRQTKRGRLQSKVYKYRSVQSFFVFSCILRLVTTCTGRFLSAGVYPVCCGKLIDKYNFLLNRVGRTIGKQNLVLLYQRSLMYLDTCRESVERSGIVNEIVALILSTMFDLLPCFVLKESEITVTDQQIEYNCRLPGCWMVKMPLTACNSMLDAVDLFYIMDCLQEMAAVSTFQFAGAEYLGKEQYTGKREIPGVEDEVIHFGHFDPPTMENAPFLSLYFCIQLTEPIKEVQESTLGELDTRDVLMVLRSDNCVTKGPPVHYTYSNSPATMPSPYYPCLADDIDTAFHICLSNEIHANRIMTSPYERSVVPFSKPTSPFGDNMEWLAGRRPRLDNEAIETSPRSSRSVVQNTSHRRRRSSSNDSSTSPPAHRSKIIKLSF